MLEGIQNTDPTGYPILLGSNWQDRTSILEPGVELRFCPAIQAAADFSNVGFVRDIFQGIPYVTCEHLNKIWDPVLRHSP